MSEPIPATQQDAPMKQVKLRYHADRDGGRWLIRDRVENGRIVGVVWSRFEPTETIDSLNLLGYVED